MSDWVWIPIAAGYLVWIGFIWGEWSSFRRHSGRVKLGECVIEQAKHLKQSRVFTGPGPDIINESHWRLGSLGMFKISITESTGE